MGRRRLGPPLWLVILTLYGLTMRAATAADLRPHLSIESYTLPNGLRVVLQHDSRLPRVALSIYVHAGGANDPVGRSGFAHLFEHLVFLDTEHIDKSTQDRLFTRIGSSDEAFTNYDVTLFGMEGPPEHLETMLWLESDRLGFLQFQPDGFATQKQIVREERRVRRESNPFSPADERLMELLYPKPHPYAGMVLGSHEDIERATREDVEAFYHQNYVASNTTVVVVGQFDAAKVRKWIVKYFGPLPRRARPSLPENAIVQPRPEKTAREQVTGDVPQTRLSIGWVGPPATDKATEAGNLLASVLGDSNSSYLARRLVLESKLAQQVQCSFTPLRLGSLVRCDVFAAPRVTAAELEDATIKAMRSFLMDGLTEAALNSAKAKWKMQILRQVESFRDRAMLLNNLLLFRGRVDALDADWKFVENLSAGDLMTIARQWLAIEHCALVVIAPSPRTER